MAIVLLFVVALTGAAFKVAPALYILPFCVFPLVRGRRWWGLAFCCYAWLQVLGLLPRALSLFDTVDTACMVTLFVACLEKRGWFELDGVMVIGLGVGVLDILGVPIFNYPNQAGIFYAALAILTLRYHSAPPALLIFCMCVYHTGCESAMLLLVLVLSGWFLYKFRGYWVVLLPIIGGVVLIMGLYFGEDVWQHCASALTRRVWQYDLALNMIGDSPLFGFGGGSYRWIQTTYLMRQGPLSVDVISLVYGKGSGMLHCDYLDALVSFGVVGTAILMVTVGRQLYYRREPLVMLALGVIGVQALIDLPLRSMPVIILAAILLAENENNEHHNYQRLG